MRNLPQKVSQYTIDGLRELSEHPTKYLAKAGKSFCQDVGTLVKDNWDAGVAVAPWLALTPQGDNLFGDYRFLAPILGSALSTIGGAIRDSGGLRNLLNGYDAEGYSLRRNICLGFAGVLIALDINVNRDTLLMEIAHDKLLDAIPIVVAFWMDYDRRNPIENSQGNSNTLDGSFKRSIPQTS